MLREAVAAGILVVLAFLPAAPASSLDCSAALALEESAQNDAESGDDAPDDAALALRIPHDAYYWAYLSALDHDAADLHDWYVFAVTPGTPSVMANVIVSAPGVPNEMYLPDTAQRFYLTMTAPDGVSQTVTSAGGAARFVDPVPGDYLIEIWTLPPASPVACEGAGSDLGTPGTPLARNHGLYVGCNPFCAPKTAGLR